MNLEPMPQHDTDTGEPIEVVILLGIYFVIMIIGLILWALI